MINLKVEIQTLEMAGKGHTIGDDVHPENVIQAEDMTVGILEGGMQSGAASVMFVLDLPDGTKAIGQCSAKQLHALDTTLQGAEERFGDNDD